MAKHEGLEQQPGLHIDTANGSPGGDCASGLGSLGDGDKGSAASSFRSACDFCHTKRIKCKRDDGDPHSGRCQQCTRRKIECKFSYKEKTGPKPKVVRGAREGGRSPGAGRNRTASLSPPPQQQQHRSAARHAPPPQQHSPTATGSLSPVAHHSSPRRGGAAARPERRGSGGGGGGGAAVAQQAGGVMPPAEQVKLEKLFLHSYLTTVAKLLPFCDERAVADAMALRERAPSPNAVPSSVAQAQLAAALAIGALIRSNRVADQYHSAARAHLKALFSTPSPEAAAVLCMLAFYWQYRGDDEKKTVYLRHARLGLDKARAAPPLELQLCMEHLDYEAAGRPERDGRALPPRLRALHTISCVLADITDLMEPVAGHTLAHVYSGELGACAAALDAARGEGLPALLCTALHAFLLVMLGRGGDAAAALRGVPALLDACPDAPRALPLSWDASLIAASLAFLLRLAPTYARVHAAVERAQNATAATQWTCRLPAPGAPLELYLHHACRSTSNICTIICQVGRQTGCGVTSFFTTGSPTAAAAAPHLSPPPPQHHQHHIAPPPPPQQQHYAMHAPPPTQGHHQHLSNAAAAAAPPPPAAAAPAQRRSHYEIAGVDMLDDLAPDARGGGSQMLNSNQASPVPYTPKRQRNSQCATPTGSLSPTGPAAGGGGGAMLLPPPQQQQQASLDQFGIYSPPPPARAHQALHSGGAAQQQGGGYGYGYAASPPPTQQLNGAIGGGSMHQLDAQESMYSSYAPRLGGEGGHGGGGGSSGPASPDMGSGLAGGMGAAAAAAHGGSGGALQGGLHDHMDDPALAQQLDVLSQGLDLAHLDPGSSHGGGGGGGSGPGSGGSGGGGGGHHRRLSSTLMDFITSGAGGAHDDLLDDLDGNGILAGLALDDGIGGGGGSGAIGSSGSGGGGAPGSGGGAEHHGDALSRQDSAYSEAMLSMLGDSDLMGVLDEWGTSADPLDPVQLGGSGGGAHDGGGLPV